MTAGEAAEATKILKCGKAVPMHYGAIIGGEGDAEEFKRKAACPVEILPLTNALP
jgi:L-ascorbate metabolism protein UlaG (beta-lactamase superfamily)